MPVLKSNLPRLSPTKLHGGPVKLQKELILGRRMSAGTNPFEDDLSDKLNPFADDLKNPFSEEEEEEERHTEGSSGTLHSSNGLTPKRGDEKYGSLLRKLLPKEKKGKSPVEEKGGERKSLFPSPSSKSGKAEPEGRQRMPFLKQGKGKAETGQDKSAGQKTADQATKANEPLSVLEILQLIQKRELAAADRHIIELEAEYERLSPQTPEGKDSGRRAKDVALLYEELESELRRIVGASLAQPPDPSHLGQVARAVEQEERADRAREGGGGEAPPGRRPRELKKKWREAVQASVSERLSPGQAVENASVAQRLRSLQERTVADLISVRKNVAPGYPKEYEAFSVYVRSYHEGVSFCLSEMVQRELEVEELYVFLEWCHCLYYREVLGHAELTAHISKQHLAPLLPEDTVRRLEDRCVSMVKAQITKHMETELCAEQDKWKQGRNIFQSELASRVIQILKEHIEKSSAITEELGARIAESCLHILANFLQSFQANVQELYAHFAVNMAGMECVVPQTIAVVNCCPAFRDYVGRLIQKFSPEGEEWKKKITEPLDKVERGGIKLLMEKLFSELKPHFAKLLRKKWLQNAESFESIVTAIREHFKHFHKMKTPPYQTLVNSVHLQVVTEYLRALVQRRVTCTSGEMRARLAQRIGEESEQLLQLFHNLNSTSSWLDAAIGHQAEIIKLKEISSIQMEVGVLVSSYPDIRKGHISAVLHMRGDLSSSDRHSILEAVQELNGQSRGLDLPRDRGLFSEIAETAEARCFRENSVSSCMARWIYAIRGR